MADVETGTGVIIALILALCHVSDEAIADEYSLTEIGLAPRKEEIIQRLIRPGEALEGDRERAERMVSARYVEAAIFCVSLVSANSFPSHLLRCMCHTSWHTSSLLLSAVSSSIPCLPGSRTPYQGNGSAWRLHRSRNNGRVSPARSACRSSKIPLPSPLRPCCCAC